MAAKKQVNKSQMIRDALAAYPEKSPTEIAAVLKKQGLDLTPQYVSTIKSNAKLVKSRPHRTVVMRHVASRTKAVQPGGSEFEAALHLIRTAGSLEQAQAVLSMCERIRQVV